MKVTLSNLSLKINKNIFRKFDANSSAATTHLSARGRQTRQNTCQVIGGWICEPINVIEQLIEGATPEQIHFLRNIAKKFQVNNYHLPHSKQNDSQAVLNIYKMVDNPQPIHLNIISRADGSFEDIEKLFEYATDAQSLQFVQKLQQEVLDRSHTSAKIIAEMLKSANRKAFIEHPENYTSYLKLHVKDPDTVSALDSLINRGKYDRKVFDNTLAVKNMLKNKKISSILAQEEPFLVENYTPEREKILKHLFNNHIISKKNPQMPYIKELLNIYSTTTPENISLRTDIINHFKYGVKNNNTGKTIITDEFSELNKLFARIDEDADAANFVQKALAKDLKIESVKNFNELINIVPLKKAAIFMNNVKRIVANTTSGKERQVALSKYIDYPFFKSKNLEKYSLQSFRHKSKENSFISRISKIVSNRINTLRYRWIMRNSEPEIAYITSKNDKGIIVEKLNATANSLPLTNKVKETFYEKKLRLSNEAKDYVKSKLSKKHMYDFGDIFSIKATKIRLTLLPEIFASIKDTCKCARKNGITIPPVSKTDSATLYELINGKNRKLVRYMLKKRDDNGNRRFTVKDIIHVIKDTDTNIAHAKTRSKGYNADYAKKYYEKILYSFVSEFGNLRRVNNVYQ